VATPTNGWAISSSLNPMAYSIARCGADFGPTVVYRLTSFDLSHFFKAIPPARPFLTNT